MKTLLVFVIISQITEWTDSVKEFTNGIDDKSKDVNSYLDTFSSSFNKLSSGIPIIGAFVAFALLMIVIKKVVGR